MNRMRISLFYLGSYLAIIGFGLLFVPHETLKILQSNGDYDNVFPRVAGMLMSGLGLSIFGIIRARASEFVSCDAVYPCVLYCLHCSVLRHDRRSAVPGLDRYRWPWARSNAGLLPPRSQEFTLKSKHAPH